MKFPSILSIFKKKHNKTLHIPDSLLIKKLKNVCEANNLSFYENITIYHRNESFFIKLLIVDSSRGIYLFEYKEWSYHDLKDSKITKASNQNFSEDNLAFDKAHDFIKQKFNELVHNDALDIYNFLLMENLNTHDYAHLDKEAQKLLPFGKIMFNDSQEADISQKLQNVATKTTNITNIDNLMSNLFVQYMILSDDNKAYMATLEQRNFIDSPLDGHKFIEAKTKSGKSSTILLKAIIEKFKNPNLDIVIIEPTILACDILKNKFVNLIEKTFLDLDITSIDIITPRELVNKHLKKIGKREKFGEFAIDKELMKKDFKVADFIICDDANIAGKEFSEYLKHIQKNSNLILINDIEPEDTNYKFTKSFREDKDRKILFKQSESIDMVESIIDEEANTNKTFLIVGTKYSIDELYDNIKYKTNNDNILFNEFSNLIDQKSSSIKLCTFSQLGGLDADNIIVLDVCIEDVERVIYAANLGKEKIYLLFRDECKDLDILAKVLL